jgi:hypothetical protein
VKVSTDPTAWIDEECYPPGFQWADPSKIQVGQVFHLLDHWRQRQESGLTPLIWNPSCELLADAEQQSKHVRSRRDIQHDSDSEDDSGEEDITTELGRRDIHHDHNSENDSGEEDFTKELENVFENDAESRHSSPNPSEHGMYMITTHLSIYTVL